MVFKKGHRDFVPIESRKKAGKKMEGNTNGFKKGMIPWNKGKPMAEVQKKKLSETRIKILKDGLIPGNYKHGRCRKVKNGKPYSHFVWCSEPGNHFYVPKGFVIHHLDLNPHNNNANNLLLMQRGDHTGFHKRLAKIIKGGE